MLYLITFLLALPSGILWIFNGELLVVTQVQNGGGVPWAVALITTAGQFCGYATLYLFADQFLARLKFVQRAITKVKLGQPGWGTYAMFATGGLCGIPPLLALFSLYGSARAGHLTRLIAFALPGRICWYMTWAYAPDFLREHFGLFT